MTAVESRRPGVGFDHSAIRAFIDAPSINPQLAVTASCLHPRDLQQAVTYMWDTCGNPLTWKSVRPRALLRSEVDFKNLATTSNITDAAIAGAKGPRACI